MFSDAIRANDRSTKRLKGPDNHVIHVPNVRWPCDMLNITPHMNMNPLKCQICNIQILGMYLYIIFISKSNELLI